MRSEWKTEQLSLLANIQTDPFGSQLHKEDYVECGTPIVTVEHLGKKDFTKQNLPRVSSIDKERLSKYILKTGDIVFSRVGSVDRCSFVSEKYNGWLFSGRCLRVRPKKSINSEYLYYFFCNEKTKQFIQNIAVGATMPSINTKLMGEIPISYPCLKTQKNITNILRSLDEKISLNTKINNNLQQQLHSLFVQIFAGIDMDVTLGEVVGTTSGGTPSRKHDEYYDSGSICWVKSKELLGSYIHDTEEHINNLAVAKSAAKLLPAHSVLIAMYGATVGAYGIISKSMACNQAVCALLDNEKYPYTYLFQMACESQKKFVNLAIGSAQQNISQVLIKQLPIHSDVGNIQRFHSLAQPMHEEMELLQAENRHLSVLRDSLLPQLMSGELDVSDVNL